MRNHKLFWGSSYDRGLQILLDMWPKILEAYPDATLDVCYGWDLFDKVYLDNPERQNWKKKINEKMTQKGITHHGRVGKDELHQIRSKCGIWTYPTDFQEINCITALECQYDCLVPVTMDSFALSETVGTGSKVKGDIYDVEVKNEYLVQLFKWMGDEELWKEESIIAHAFALKYSWDNIAKAWEEYL